jgi:cell division transport system permease protein
MDQDLMAPRAMSGLLPRIETPIVPKRSIAGRALVAVVAIMTFLASLTTGAVMLVRTSATEWQSEVSREVTIQVRPVQGRDVEADVSRAADIARAYPGIADVRPYSKDESARLLEPWLGGALSLDDLPVPRMIVVTLQDGGIDLAPLRKALTERVTSASLDDHRGWIERMRTMAQTTVAAGIGVLLLMVAATVLSVIFATRGAMATNRPIVEVLHFIGAKSGFIAQQFQRHFLVLGLEGGLIGGGLAMLVFGVASIAANMTVGRASSDQLAALFGTFSLSLGGYIAIVAQIVLMAVVTAIASRRTVNRTLDFVE